VVGDLLKNNCFASKTSQTALAAGREKYHRAKGQAVPKPDMADLAQADGVIVARSGSIDLDEDRRAMSDSERGRYAHGKAIHFHPLFSNNSWLGSFGISREDDDDDGDF
jgi:surface antigen